MKILGLLETYQRCRVPLTEAQEKAMEVTILLDDGKWCYRKWNRFYLRVKRYHEKLATNRMTS